jgi:hypothetical protein
MNRPVDSPLGVVAFSDAQEARELRIEAESFAFKYGKNAYSDFILKHGRRPDRAEASTIGRLIGLQVKAADGTMQPRPTKAERLAAHEAKQGRNEQHRIWDHIARLRCALDQLAKNEDDPAAIVGGICAHDRPKLGANLEKSLAWLIRFADEWDRHGTQIAHETPFASPRGLFRFKKIGVRPDNDP